MTSRSLVARSMILALTIGALAIGCGGGDAAVDAGGARDGARPVDGGAVDARPIGDRDAWSETPDGGPIDEDDAGIDDGDAALEPDAAIPTDDAAVPTDDAAVPDDDAAVPSDDAGARPDASSPVDAGIGRDARVVDPDAAIMPGTCPQRVGVDPGAACSSAGACVFPLSCEEEVAGSFTDTFDLDGTSGPALPLRIFPGSMCSELCDPSAAIDECGECATCDNGALAGRVRFLAGADETEGFCRRDCTVTAADPRGGCREGYQCDPVSQVCLEACTSDDQCRFAVGDVDGDGVGEIVYGGADYPAVCDAASGRCVVSGTPGGVAGSTCEEDLDCYDSGFCLTGAAGTALEDGFCTRLFCGPGNECGSGEVCSAALFSDATACLPGCTIGGETTDAQRAGATGRNPDCDPGQACFWDGATGPDGDPNGGCFPGNYNTETTYDVGTACLDDGDCYSPFGYGRCLFATDDSLARIQSGVCAVSSCAGGADGEPISLVPGVAIPAAWEPRVCDVAGGDICVNFGTDVAPATFCVEGCASGDECAPGYACAPLLAGGESVCWPNCTADGDCHTGATCRDTSGLSCGIDEECYCSDARPR
jgi:hypothetical protein